MYKLNETFTKSVMVSDEMTEETISIKKATYKKMLVALVVVLVALSFTAGFIIGGSGKAATGQVIAQPTTTQTQPSGQQAPAGRIQVSADDDPVIGDANAKVTVIEFSDFQCPFCRRFYTQTLSQIENDYITLTR